MKQKIYIKRFSKDVELPRIIAKGDWIDLRSAEEVTLKTPVTKTVSKVNQRKLSLVQLLFLLE